MLNKLSTSTKFYLLIFITAASLIGLGLYAINDLKKMDDNTRTLYSDRIVCIQQLSNIRRVYAGDILPIPRGVQKHKLSFSEAKTRVQQAQEIIDTNWRNYKRTSITPAERILVEQADVLKTAADEANKKLVSILNKKDTLAINQLVQMENPTTSAPFAVKVTQLIDLQVRVAKDILNNNKQLYQTTSTNFILLILLSLAIALSLSFYIVKNIKGLIKDILTSNNIIKESEAKYRSVLEQASDAIYILNLQGNFTDVNESICKATGYSKEELLQLNIEDIIDPEQLKTDPLVPGYYRADRSFIRERRILRKDGTIFEVEINIKKIAEDRILVIARDISERKQLEANVKEAELKFRTLAEKSIVGVYIIQGEGFVYLNPRLAEIFGYEQHELLNLKGSIIDNLVSEGDRERVTNNVKARYSGDVDNVHYEYTGVRKDGTHNNVEIFGSRVTIDGKSCIIGSMIDITERKIAEELILKEKELSNTIINSLPGVFYLRNDAGEFLRWNKNFETVTGYTPEEIKKINAGDMIAREDQDKVKKNIETAFSDGHAMVEASAITKGGIHVPMLFSAASINFEGKPCLLGMGFDISSRIKAEQNLKKSEANLKTILDTTDTAYALLDKALNVMAFNQMALKFVSTQYRQVPAKGDKLGDFLPMDRFPEFRAHVDEVLNGSNISYEVSYPQTDGSLLWYYVRLFPIINEKNEIFGSMLALSDITERKDAEESLKAAYNRIQDHINSIKDMAWKQSHLIRSPLANLKGLAVMLKDDPSDSEVLGFIQTELERLDQVIIEMAEDASRQEL